MTTDNSKVSANGNTWIVALLMLCLALLGYGALLSTNTVSNSAYLAGKYLVYVLFIWGIFYSAFLKNRGLWIGLGAFVAIFLALFTGGIISATKHKQQAAQAVSSIQKELNRLAGDGTDSSGFPTRTKHAASQTQVATGEFGEMERFMKGFLVKSASLRNAYQMEIEATGWGSILDAKRIKSDSSLSESRAIIKRAKAIVEKFESKTADLLHEARADIASLNISETSKREMLAGFENGMRESAKEIDEQWSLEKQIVSQVENIFLMLTASKAWSVDGDQLVFYSEDQLARYNSYIEAIQDLTQQQEKIQKRNLSEANRKLESIKNQTQR